MKITLELDESDARVLIEAVETHVRFNLGQMENLHKNMRDSLTQEEIKTIKSRESTIIGHMQKFTGSAPDVDLGEELMYLYKALMTGYFVGGYGLHSPEIKDRVRQARDIGRVIESALNPKNNRQVSKSSKSPDTKLPVVEIEETAHD